MSSDSLSQACPLVLLCCASLAAALLSGLLYWGRGRLAKLAGKPEPGQGPGPLPAPTHYQEMVQLGGGTTLQPELYTDPAQAVQQDQYTFYQPFYQQPGWPPDPSQSQEWQQSQGQDWLPDPGSPGVSPYAVIQCGPGLAGCPARHRCEI